MFRRIGAVLGVVVAATAAGEEGGGHVPHYVEYGPHHLSLFTGVTDISGKDTAFTLGLDYEYRLNDRLGIGTVVEEAFGEIDATTILAVADIHLGHGALIMQVGPGVEILDDKELFVARVGMLYEFERGAYTISPQLHYDYHDGGKDALVLGLAFGMSF
ncbi:MAG: hypothetical protein AAGI67_12740 [Pseudomonadota bacterium]